jgi:hypothetical protein
MTFALALPAAAGAEDVEAGATGAAAMLAVSALSGFALTAGAAAAVGAGAVGAGVLGAVAGAAAVSGVVAAGLAGELAGEFAAEGGVKSMTTLGVVAAPVGSSTPDTGLCGLRSTSIAGVADRMRPSSPR